MRNLQEYPPTKQEILLFLGAERSEHDPEITGLVGDMTPVLIEHIIELVQCAFALAEGFERRSHERGMGFVVPFPEATKLLEAVGKIDVQSA